MDNMFARWNKCNECKTRTERTNAYIDSLNRYELVDYIQGNVVEPDGLLCHDATMVRSAMLEHAINTAVLVHRWPFTFGRTRFDVPLVFALEKDPEMQMVLEFCDALFKLEDGIIIMQNPVNLVSGERHYKKTGPRVMQIYLTQILCTERLLNCTSILGLFTRMSLVSKYLISTVFIIEVLGLIELNTGVLLKKSLSGFSHKDLNFVTKDVSAFFPEWVGQALHEYGYFIFFVKDSGMRVPLKHYIPEELVTADTFRQSAVKMDHSAQRVQCRQEGEDFIAVAVVDGQRYVGQGESSIIASEEATRKAVDERTGAPRLQLFRRIMGGENTHDEITENPHISSRYVLGVTLNVPRGTWHRVEANVYPVMDDGERKTHECRSSKHVSGACNIKTFMDGKTINSAVPGRYRTFLSYAITFGLCKGPKCGMHTPQVYELEFIEGEDVYRTLFSVSNHQSTRGDLELFESTRKAVHARVLRAKLIAPPKTKIEDLSISYKVGDKLRKSKNYDLPEEKRLKDSLDDRRRFDPQGNERVIPIAPSMVRVETNEVDALLNFVRLHCPGAYGYSSTNIGVRLMYMSMAQAMGDSIKMSTAGFSVAETTFVGSEEFLSMCSAGHVFDRRHGKETPLRISDPLPPLIVDGYQCRCVGPCSDACKFEHKWFYDKNN